MMLDKFPNYSEQFYTLSIAYIDMAITSAKHIDNKKLKLNEYQKPIAFLTLHAFELFLKSVLIYKVEDDEEYNKTCKSFTHDINDLYKKYRKIYIDELYQINHPFDFSLNTYQASIGNPNEKELYAQFIKDNNPKNLTQYLRYPLICQHFIGHKNYNLTNHF